MHEVILGKFGSGKSLYGTELVERELLTGNRPIVTTLALRLDQLNSHVQRLDPDRDCRVFQRVFVIDRDQMRTFWRFRGVRELGEYGQIPIVLGSIMEQRQKDGQLVAEADAAWSHIEQGVCYILDEAPTAFHAREWQKTGIEFSHYITQHRKLGDDVHTLARHSNLLDKQFRDTADRCVILDNWYTKLVRGFTPPRVIKIAVYENCPPGPGEEPLVKQQMRIDPEGLAACYDTAKGLGVAGTIADKDKKSRGIPWWMIIPGGIAAGLLAWFAVSTALKGALGWGAKKVQVSKTEVRSNLVAEARSLMGGFGNVGDMKPAAAAVVPGATPAPAVVLVRAGIEVEQGEYYGIGQTGGRVFLETDSGLIWGDRLIRTNGGRVLLDGLLYKRGKRPDPILSGISKRG